jgi:hypothetical protein
VLSCNDVTQCDFPVWCICTYGGSCHWNLPNCSVQHSACSSKYGTSPVCWNPDIAVCGNCLAIIFIHVLMISEHNHELFSNMSLYSQFKPATQGALLFFLCVCTYLTFFHRKSERTSTRHWWYNMYFIFIISESQFFPCFWCCIYLTNILKKNKKKFFR